MGPFVIVIAGLLDIAVGALWLGQIIRKPPVEPPRRALIGRVLMPISMMLFGASMIIQPITAQTFILPLIAAIFAFTALILQMRYHPS
jgi:hypothetical protein